MTYIPELILLIAFLYALFVGYLYINQQNLTYYPNKNDYEPPPNAEVTLVKTEDGLELEGWFFPPAQKGRSIILMFHGNAGHIVHRVYKVPQYYQAGYGVLLAEYRGYGKNPGSPHEEGLYKDARAYYQWLIDQGIKPENIIIHGESLGSAVATQLAYENPAKALILETPFSEFSDVALFHYPFIPFARYITKEDFNSVSKIQSIDIPKLLIVAGQDEVVGQQTGLKLYEAAYEPKKLVVLENSRHSDHYNHDAGDAILSFLAKLSKK